MATFFPNYFYEQKWPKFPSVEKDQLLEIDLHEWEREEDLSALDASRRGPPEAGRNGERFYRFEETTYDL